jgi:hypothetical protein
MRYLRVLVLAAVVAPVLAAGTASAVVPVKVRATLRLEIQPAASIDHLAYSEATRARPARFNLFVKPSTAARFRVNPPGTVAFTGSIDGTTLVFWQRTLLGLGQIKFLDLISRVVTNPPVGVNTPRHETNPELSGEWLAFTRSPRRALSSPRRLILHHLTDSSQRLLDIGTDAYVQSGGLAGGYVAWTRCRFLNRCNTWLYDIAAASKRRLPNPLGRSQFAVSVTSDGTVYYAESGTILCAPRKIVRFWRQPLVGARQFIGTLARGRDPAVTSPVLLADGSVEVFFDRFDCRTGAADLYKFVIPPP